MNPLHAEGWFALGFCALKTADAARAAQAFTRAAQQDPDNGEAWNNLAAVHLKVRRCSALWKIACVVMQQCLSKNVEFGHAVLACVPIFD